MSAGAGLSRAFVALFLAAGLAACATADFDRSLERTNARVSGFTDATAVLARDAEQRQALDAKAAELLTKVLDEDLAVQLAMVNSPEFQAILARNWERAAEAAQSGRIANPVFTFERVHVLDEVEFGRLLTVGLIDLLTYPARQGVARARLAAEEERLGAEVVRKVTDVRKAWVRAVAARERLGYARQVFEAAGAAAELARRMQATGNFGTAQRVRQQGFYADAATQLALAQHEATAGREELVRQLGLAQAQVPLLVLAERLPDLPGTPLQPGEVGAAARSGNLDVHVARAEFEAAARAQGLGAVTSLVDVEGGLRRDTVFDNAEGSRATGRGYELDVTLPVFDWGGMKRDGMNARTLAAGNELEASLRTAGSRLRETYSAYRTAHDIARHYREEVIPLQQTLSEENVLRYNAMLIGVFELLADARAQIGSVMAGMDALEQFWLADAALQAAIMGTGGAAGLRAPAAAGESADAGH